MITPLLPQVNGAERLSLPNDLNMAQPLQSFARGGIVVPFQRPFLRGSDREYLEARQAEYDKYVADANAYNAALTKYQTEVYNPYKTAVEGFNAAADKYNTEIYNPYLSQVDEYNRAAAAYNTDVYQPYVSSYDAYAKAVEAWNAGDRTSDYAGPAAPTLKPFEMTAPTQPAAFSMTAPTLASEFSMARPEMPFNEEDVTKFQQEAAERAQFDASQRGLAIEAVNDPSKYNLSGFSISPRMFAQGGPVKNSAKDMLSQLQPQKFAVGGLGERFRTLDPEEGITRDDFGEGRLGSAAYQSAVGEGGIGLDAMNQNIRNFFANNPDEAATRAAMEQYGVTDADIIRATGRGLGDRFAAPASRPTGQVISDAINTGASNIASTAAAAQPVSAEPILSSEAFNRIWSIMGGGVGGPSEATLRRLRGEPEEEAPGPPPAAQAPAGSAAADLASLSRDRALPTTDNEFISPSQIVRTGDPTRAGEDLAQLPASRVGATYPIGFVGPLPPGGRIDPTLYSNEFVGPLPPGTERVSDRFKGPRGRLLLEQEFEDLALSPGSAANLLNNFDTVDQRRTIMPVTDRRTADGGTPSMPPGVPKPGDPDFVGPLPPTGGTATTGGTTTGGTATTGGTGGTTGGGTTTTAPVDPRSAGVRAATGQGGIGLDKYYENILKWFTDNPNATYADINKAQDQWGVSDQDINDAFGRSGGASRAMLYALNSADFAQTTGGRGGLAGMNYNINNWLKSNPKASVGDIYEAMIKWDLNTGDFRRATGMTPTEYFASLQKAPITPVTPGGTGTIPPIVGGTGTTTKPGGTTTTTPGGGTATRVPGSIVPIPDLAAVPGFDRPNVPLPGISTGVARTPSSGGGDGMVDIQVVVYGPDGKMYSSPSAARAAGVFNYTMTPPVTAQPTPGSTPGTVGSPNAGAIPVANPTTPGAIPIAKPTTPTLPGFTPGAPQFFGPGTPANRAPGLTPGTVPMSYNPLAAYTGPSPTAMLQQNPNLAPTVIGGGANLGVMTDRLGNKIYAPGMPPPGFASGGLAQSTAAQNAANLADEEDEGISLPNPAAPSADATPTGAQAMLAALPKTQVSTKSSPTSASVKRTSKAMLTDKMGQPKGMAMEMEQLSAAKTPAPEGKEPESARSQMEALALAYKLREREALDTAKGLMKATFSRPSLEKPSLLKGKLTKKRFADGGEAKKARGGETNESAARRLPAPSITNATLWADTVSRDMFPSSKDDVRRDAARHMLAAAIMADKTSPRIAETLGKLYEFKEAPIRTAGHWLGLSKPRPDYPTDVHNNALGATLSRLTADPEKLTQAVREAIRQGTVEIQPGKAALVPDPGRAMTYNTGDTPAEPPQYRHGGAVKHHRA